MGVVALLGFGRAGPGRALGFGMGGSDIGIVVGAAPAAESQSGIAPSIEAARNARPAQISRQET